MQLEEVSLPESSNWATWIGILVAMLSLGVSVVALIKSNRALKIEEDRERDRLQDRKKAKLRAEILEFCPRGYRLDVTNIGEAEARNPLVTINGEAVTTEHSQLVPIYEVPIKIGPRSTASFHFNARKDFHPVSILVAITWQDDFHNKNRYESNLTVLPFLR
jgi:hypothetical protein